jgi:hypothetical protein
MVELLLCDDDGDDYLDNDDVNDVDGDDRK